MAVAGRSQHMAKVLDRPLRLAILVDSLDKGGLEQVVYNLVRSLSGSHFIVTLIICSGDFGYLGNKLVSDGHDVVAVGNDKGRLQAILQERKIDVANLHYSTCYYETFCRLRIPIVYTVHNSYTWLTNQEFKARKKAYKNMSAFIAVSSQVKEYFRQRFSIAAESIEVIPNGIDVSDLADAKLPMRQKYGFLESDFIFVNVSSFTPTKFQGGMLSALKELITIKPNARLLLVGNVLDLEYHAFVMERIRDEGLAACLRIIDFVPRQELARLLGMADCFLLPSLQEGWSNAIMEAMYFGLPLILSDTGSARDLIKENDIGIIVPNPYPSINTLNSQRIKMIAYDKRPANLESMVKAMMEMIENPEQWRRKCSNTRNKIIGDLNVEQMAHRYGQLFSKVLSMHECK
ncbi:glycosyltransferase [Geotalea toluenoxydans]